ncbi:MAG: GNAT family N-acetyltransferase [Chitinispirillaceae bacterium]
MNYHIRAIKATESDLVKEFTYEAIFQKDETNPIPRKVLNQPDVSIYYEDFGKTSDLCLFAVVNGMIAGAVWTRILSGKVKGFGNIDDETPEFAISLFKEFRRKGIGTALMKAMLKLLRKHGYKRTSLAVQKDNYAVTMYKKAGFEIVKESREEYIMICKLNQEK